MMPHLTIYVPAGELEEIRGKLGDLADEAGETKSEFLRRAIRKMHRDGFPGGGRPDGERLKEGVVKWQIAKVGGTWDRLLEGLRGEGVEDPEALLERFEERGLVDISEERWGAGRRVRWIDREG